MISELFKKFTSDFTEVPLFYVLAIPHEQNEGETYETKVHPTLTADEVIAERLKGLIEHVEHLSKKFVHKGIETPLFSVTFNLKKFKENGEKGSCELMLHPQLKGDEFVINQFRALVDHIRQNYDMEDLSK